MDNQKNNQIREERRKEPRAYVIFVEYYLEQAPLLKISTFAKNISSNGIGILLAEDVKIDTTLFLKIHLLDGEKPIKVKARVIWIEASSFLSTKESKHFEAGLEYTDINDADQARILGYVVRVLNR